MPEVAHQVIICAPIDRVWSFVNDLRNWATAMPGYQDYQEIDAENSIWKLKGDAGILQKLVTFEARVTGREEPSRVQFVLRGIDELLDGSGSFAAVPAGDASTQVELSLVLKAGGLMGPVVNALLGKTLPRDVASLAGAIKANVEGREEAAHATD